MNFRNWIASTIISAVLLASSKAGYAASSPYPDCSSSASKLGIDIDICSGSDNINKNSIQKINDADTLRILGIALRRLGYLEQAKIVLERVLTISPDSENAHLSMANLIQAEFRRSLESIDFSVQSISNIENTDITLKLGKIALSDYYQILKINPNQLDAELNWIELWSRLKGNSELSKVQQDNLEIARNLINHINIQLSKNKSESLIDSRIRLSTLLLRVKSFDNSFIDIIKDNAREALLESYKLDNLWYISKAEGLQGQIYILESNDSAAFKSFSRAYSAAESIRAYDLSYIWASELGRLFTREGDDIKALSYYSDSINRIENVRLKMTSLKTELQ